LTPSAQHRSIPAGWPFGTLSSRTPSRKPNHLTLCAQLNSQSLLKNQIQHTHIREHAHTFTHAYTHAHTHINTYVYLYARTHNARFPTTTPTHPCMHHQITDGDVIAPSFLSDDSVDLISVCLIRHSPDRATISDLLDHPWLDPVRAQEANKAKQFHAFATPSPITLYVDKKKEHQQEQASSTATVSSPEKKVRPSSVVCVYVCGRGACVCVCVLLMSAEKGFRLDRVLLRVAHPRSPPPWCCVLVNAHAYCRLSSPRSSRRPESGSSWPSKPICALEKRRPPSHLFVPHSAPQECVLRLVSTMSSFR
jgi:serine/threonine protein kinase